MLKTEMGRVSVRSAHYTDQSLKAISYTLVQMARLHGEGIRKWREGGVYEITYVKDTKDGSWKITRLEHRVLAPISVSPFNREHY